MFFFFTTILTIITFILPCWTISRVVSIFLIEYNYNYFEISAVLCAKALGNFLGLLFFKKIFELIGSFRTLTVSTVILTQCLIIIFNYQNLNIFIIIFFIFGFFEQILSIIVRYALNNFSIKFMYQFEMSLDSVIRFLSGLFLILKKEDLILSLIMLINLSLIPYILNEKHSKKLDKNKIYDYTSHLLIVILKYNEYFINSMTFYISGSIVSTYLILFLNQQNIFNSKIYISIYFLGQIIFFYPFNKLIQKFKKHKQIMFLNYLTIAIVILNIIENMYNLNISFMEINIIKSINLCLLGGVFSLSLKQYVNEVQNFNSLDISINMADAQIRSLGRFFAIIIGLTAIHLKNKLSIFIAIISLNLLNLLHLYIRHTFSINKK